MTENGNKIVVNVGALALKTSASDSLSVSFENMARLYTAQGDIDRAIESYKLAVEINPEYAQTYIDMGKYYLLKGDKLNAIKNFTRAVSVDPFCARAYLALGNLFADIGEVCLAVENFRIATSIDPELKKELTDEQIACVDST